MTVPFRASRALKRRPRADKPLTIAAVRPNEGIRTAYQRRLERLVDEMAKSVAYWVTAAYRANTPEMAQDASPAMAMRAVVRRLTRRWQKRFDQAAPEMADYFATAVGERTDGALAAILKRAGISVEFRLTAAANDVLQATVGENVSLIRSIASEYLSDVEGLVMRSVQAGRDMGALSEALQARHGVTKRRAAFISVDQNNKATAAINRVRQEELGIEEAVWLRSNGGKKPRPDHVAYSGKRYKVKEGAYISGEYIYPGQKPRCRCVSKSIVPGFS